MDFRKTIKNKTMKKIYLTLMLLISVASLFGQRFTNKHIQTRTITGYPSWLTPNFLGEIIYSSDRDAYYESIGIAEGEWRLWNPLSGSFQGDGTKIAILDQKLEINLATSSPNYSIGLDMEGYLQIKNPDDNGVRIGNLGTTSQLSTAPNSVIFGDRNVVSTSGILERSLVIGLHGGRNADGVENILLSVGTSGVEGAGSSLIGSNNIAIGKNSLKDSYGSKAIALGSSAGTYTGTTGTPTTSLIAIGSNAAQGQSSENSEISQGLAIGVSAMQAYVGSNAYRQIIAIGQNSVRRRYDSAEAENIVGIGHGAAYQSGWNNSSTYVGHGSGEYQTGQGSSMFGYRSGYLGSSKQSNIFGSEAGYYSTNYASQIIGTLAGANLNTTNSVLIGWRAGRFDNTSNSFSDSKSISVTVNNSDLTTGNGYDQNSWNGFGSIYTALGASIGTKVYVQVGSITGTAPANSSGTSITTGNKFFGRFTSTTELTFDRDLSQNSDGTGTVTFETFALVNNSIVLGNIDGQSIESSTAYIGHNSVDSTHFGQILGLEHEPAQNGFRFYQTRDFGSTTAGQTALDFTFGNTNAITDNRLRVNGVIEYNDGTNWVAVGAGGSSGSTYTYTQTSHGFSIGDGVIFTAIGFTAPSSNQLPIAVVIDVPDANTLTISNKAIFEEGDFTGWSSEADGQYYHTNAGTSGTADAVVRRIWNKQNGLVFIDIELEESSGITNFTISDAQGGEIINTSGQSYVLNANKVNYSNTIDGVAVSNLDDAVNELVSVAIDDSYNSTTSTTLITFNSINIVDVSSTPQTLEVPSNAATGDWFIVVDSEGNSFTNNITIDFTTNGFPVEAGTVANQTINTNNGKAKYVYINSTYGFIREY